VIDLALVARRANDLQPLPVTVTRLAALFADDRVDLADVAEVVGFDQALAATVIRTANSTLHAGRTSVTTTRDAVTRLGAGAVLSLATGSQVRRQLERPIPEYGLGAGDLWRHSVAASLAAECMGSHCTGFVPPASVTAALLHDVGKLVMARFLTTDVRRAVDRAQREHGLTRVAAEVEQLAVHHGEVGGLVAQRWGLPDQIVVGIIYHHVPGEIGAEPVAHAVHVADVVAKAIGAGLADENQDPGADLASMRGLGMTPTGLEELCAQVHERFDDVLARFGSSPGPTGTWR
jgi:HD-like signal output (HDOD) protein